MLAPQQYLLKHCELFFRSFINTSACKQKVIEMFQLIKVRY